MPITSRLFTKVIHLLFLICSIALTTGCAILDTRNSFDHTAVFQSYQNFGWCGIQASPDTVNTNYSPLLDQMVKAAVATELVRDGLRPADVGETPDLMIAYDIALDPPQQPINEAAYAPGFGYGYSYWYGYRYDYGFTNLPDFQRISDYALGTLVIDLIDPDTNEVVWRGWAVSVIDPLDIKEGTISRVVASIMAQYPPPTSTQRLLR
ncbi:DUF4136 domain-containing protein [Pontibacter harenae]|uniref:DUF4136 domain-containing protein n=1 Tax=Pontibacter harenae TaxID=2894083 RepID=UPI001E40AB30|nr:DUF4136 domain-containing protein [Pontibacter harenae]MCC9166526.1 DUF4136 domain-containing protein [Pontibacter harenae]